MSEELLNIKDLHVKAEEKEILKGINLSINKGEIHVIMGPNGSGKTTTANAIFNNPHFTKTSGTITFCNDDITNLKTDEIARKGIFMSFQLPEEIPGISVANFLKTAKSKITNQPVKVFAFKEELKKNMEELSIKPEYIDRSLNVGFSGGEKKKNEILQMKMLEPSLSILDEIDSGLDVDAVRVVSDNVNELKKKNNMSLLIISHYHRLYEYIKADKVVVIADGRIVKEGDASLIDYIDQYGYDQIKKDAGIEDEVELLETCAFKEAHNA